MSPLSPQESNYFFRWISEFGRSYELDQKVDEISDAHLTGAIPYIESVWLHPVPREHLYPRIMDCFLLCCPDQQFQRQQQQQQQQTHLTSEAIRQIAAKWIWQMTQLYRLMKERQLLESEEGIEMFNKLRRCFEAVTQGRAFLDTCNSLSTSMDTERDAAREEEDIPVTFLMTENLPDYNNLHRSVFNILRLLEQRGFKKFGQLNDECWSPSLVEMENGGWKESYAWKMEMTLSQFIDENITKELDPEMWCLRTKHGMRSTREIEELICHSSHAEFPALELNRNFYSYQNGVYSMYHCFFPFDRKSEWRRIAENATCVWNMAGFEDVVVEAPKDSDCSVMLLQTDFPMEFSETSILSSDLQSSVVSKLMNPQRMGGLHKLVSAQKELEPLDVQWMLALLGQALRKKGWCNENWQNLFVFLGVSNSGKSTLINHLTSFIPESKIGTISSSGEETFGLESLWGQADNPNWICIWPEAKDRCGIGQHDLQSMVTGVERVSIARKNKSALSKVWDIPIVMATNKLPSFDNFEGAMTRRLSIVPWMSSIERSDTNLKDTLKNEKGDFLALVNICYCSMLHKYGHMSLNDQINGVPIVGRQMVKAKETALMQLDLLFRFIMESHSFEFRPGLKLSRKEFVNVFREWRDDRNISQRWEWSDQTTRRAFEEKGLALDVIDGEEYVCNIGFRE